MTTEPGLSTRVFLSYAQQDKALKQELVNHLAALLQSGQITLWAEREIQPGTDWSHEIDPRLPTADLILLLMSADLLGSGYCSGAEVRQAFEKYDDRKAILLPIIVRRVDLAGLPLRHLQTLPGDDKEIWKPVMAWEDRDEAWWKVARGIRHATEMLHPR